MKLYAVVDKKSTCAEYFIATCDEDAFRIWFCMAVSSRPMYDFLDDYHLEEVCTLAHTRTSSASKIVVDGLELKRQIDQRREREEKDNG